jgi:DNA-binding NarL/FixJ family response regulator
LSDVTEHPPRLVRVAIVDDDARVRAALVELLGSEPGVEVVGTADDASSAVDLVAATEPDVVVLDVVMPGGGPAAAALICARHPATAVVALSANADAATRSRMADAGAVRFVAKGDMGDLVDVVIAAAPPRA